MINTLTRSIIAVPTIQCWSNLIQVLTKESLTPCSKVTHSCQNLQFFLCRRVAAAHIRRLTEEKRTKSLRTIWTKPQIDIGEMGGKKAWYLKYRSNLNGYSSNVFGQRINTVLSGVRQRRSDLIQWYIRSPRGIFIISLKNPLKAF